MYIINVLMPFETLIDTDMGLWELIKYDYRNDIFFLSGMFDIKDIHKKYYMVTRNYRNPLMILLSEQSEELANDFYNQFMEKEYESILRLSPNTDVCKIIDLMRKNKSNIVRLTILCKSELEKKIYIDRHLPYDHILVGEPKDFNIQDYGTMFIKDIHDVDKYRNLSGKTLYIANYGFNVTIDPSKVNPLLPLEFIEKYGKDNEFFIYSVYTFDSRELPTG